jgi:hypothetical protein
MVYLNANKELAVSGITTTVMGYIDPTSSIQTQLNSKQSTLSNSADLAGALSDETGTGAAVFGNSPTLTTPSLGAATATSINVGTGTTITKVVAATATLDFDLSSSASQDLTITVTGAALGDAVFVGVPHGSITADTVYSGWVSATDTVTIRAMRIAGTPNPASGTFRAAIVKF